MLAVAALAHPASRLGPIVGCRPMRWIGERSYGIYLWHFPIIVLTTPEGAQGRVDLLRAVLQVAAIFGIAALSWSYVEDPIRHGALGRLWEQLRAGALAAAAGRPRRRLGARRRSAPWSSPSRVAGLAGVGVARARRGAVGLRDRGQDASPRRT